MGATGSLVAVDSGRSRCRAAVIGVDGRLGPVAVGPGLPATAGPLAVDGMVESLVATVTSAVVAAAAARHEVGPVETVSAGLAGLLGARDVAPAVAARRRCLELLGDKLAVIALFDRVAPRFVDRPGGYTRIVRLAHPRLGDAGPRAILEFVGVRDRTVARSQRPVFDSADEEEAVEPASV